MHTIYWPPKGWQWQEHPCHRPRAGRKAGNETDLQGTPSNWQRRRIETELRTRLLLDAA